MLVIRLQRTGRSGHAMFRLVVQDSRRTPTSGKLVAQLGSYDPHSKNVQLDKEKAEFYLSHGAQPSPRVVSILKGEKIKLPSWVTDLKPADGKIRNPDKRRSTAPKQPEETAQEPEEAAEVSSEESATESAPTQENPTES